MAEIQGKNEKLRNVRIQNEKKEVEENARKSDRTHGTKMVLEQYIKWLDLEDEQVPDVSSPKGNLHVIIFKVDLHILVSLCK